MEDNKNQIKEQSSVLSILDEVLYESSPKKGISIPAKTETEKLLEEALKTLTKSEKEYGLMHHITFRTPKEVEELKESYRKYKEVEELKESYRKYKTFTFGHKLKAIWNLLFGKVTPQLFMYVIDKEIEKNFTVPLDPALDPLATRPTTSMESVMENVKARVENDSTRMANDLDKSIQKLTPPKIVETIRMNSTKKRTTTKKVVKPTKAATPATKRSPKKTK